MKKFLLFLPLLLVSLSHAADDKYFPVVNFIGGLNSNYSSLAIGDTEVQDALNVWFDEDYSVVKRKGFALYGSSSSLAYTNAWEYTDATNSNWLLMLSSDAIRASNGDGVFDVLVATVPPASQSLVGAVHAFGNIYFTDTVQGVYYWNGTSTTYVSGSPKGELIVEYKGRLLVAGKSHPNQNELSLSGYLSGSTWTTGTLATDPITYIVGLDDRADGISGMFSGLNDAVYIFKRGFIYALYGFDQDDFQIRVLSNESGCIDAGTIQPFAGGIVYLSKRGFEIFDGVTPHLISNKIYNKLSSSLATSFSQRSYTFNSAADWNSGSITPSSYLSTTINSGSISLATQPAVNFTHDSASDFSSYLDSATVVNIDTYTTAGTVSLKFGAGALESFNADGILVTPSVANNSACSGTYSAGSQQFTLSTTVVLQSISADMFKAGSPGSYLVSVLTDNGADEPNVVIASGSISPGSLSAGNNNDVVTLLVGSPTLTANTLYWVKLEPQGSCTFPATAISFRTAVVDAPYVTYYGAGSSKDRNSHIGQFKIKGTRYPTTGSIRSIALDVGFATDTWRWTWGALSANETLNGQTITYQTESSHDSSSWETAATVVNGANIGSSVRRYLRYTLTLNSSNAASTPLMNSISLNTSRLVRSTGTWNSPIFNIGTNIATFGNMEVSQVTSSSGTITYRLCTDNNANFSSPACVNQVANSQITASTDSYARLSSSFTALALITTTGEPILNSAVIKWNEGTRRPRMSSAIYKNRYWVSLTTTPTNLSNDATLVLSRGINNDSLLWTIFDIRAGAYVLYRDELYHGNSVSNGEVYLDDTGYEDDGLAINSYFRTKDYAPDGPLPEKIFKEFRVLSDNLDGATFSTSYFLDRGSNEFSLSSVATDENDGDINTILPFPSSNQLFGRTISLKFSNNMLDHQMRIYGGVLSYRSRPIQ